MTRRPRRNHSPAFKAKVAVAAIKGETGVVGDAAKAAPEPVIDVKTLHAKIGELTRENDFFVRRVLAWRVSITLEADFCIEAVEEALAKHGAPEIFNTDQGCQFTSVIPPESNGLDK